MTATPALPRGCCANLPSGQVIPVKRAAAGRAPAAPIDNRNRNSFSRPLELPLEKVPSCAQ
jgi:hypothetical protein